MQELATCTVPSVINENCIGERGCHDFTLPTFASLMGYTTLSKNITGGFTCVGVFPGFLCFLSGNLANAHLHFITFCLCACVKHLLHI